MHPETERLGHQQQRQRHHISTSRSRIASVLARYCTGRSGSRPRRRKSGCRGSRTTVKKVLHPATLARCLLRRSDGECACGAGHACIACRASSIALLACSMARRSRLVARAVLCANPGRCRRNASIFDAASCNARAKQMQGYCTVNLAEVHISRGDRVTICLLTSGKVSIVHLRQSRDTCDRDATPVSAVSALTPPARRRARRPDPYRRHPSTNGRRLARARSGHSHAAGKPARRHCRAPGSRR